MFKGKKYPLSVPTHQDDSAKVPRDGQKPQSATAAYTLMSGRWGRGRSKGNRQLLLSKFVWPALKRYRYLQNRHAKSRISYVQ